MQIDAWQATETEAICHNSTKFYRFAIKPIRGDCILSFGAALSNALLLDIKHLLKPGIDMDCVLLESE